ncbi:MAG: ROK family protein [Arthrobacter sp.]|uniref:ROK family protein n=1 Tax=unclassified Arthrobacter TaxID=235627 RepID=UPI0026553FB5|nr:ROK family protein [Micrococcaceae bacterium]MDN5812884.1 ROK family protein [Micrococcaceae bacterium]MDN5823939.1 ROK family protein [Micrococcaceae bacterium]MDN5878935.1 ROK family protein [Micrococcaceae bacterium]MDN5886354.1 ROK family protein [Micrococcaceae bacterium]
MEPAYLLFDIGGTDIKAALATPDGTLHTVLRSPTPQAGDPEAAAVLAELDVLRGRLLAGSPSLTPVAAGVVVCGTVDEQAGTGVFSSNLGWRNVPFRRLCTERFGIPTGFGHDVGTAGEAELALGAGRVLGRQAANTAVLVIGTGIAGALFVDGRRLEAGGFAGEIGHAAVPGGLDCPCGAHGCLETVGSAAAIARNYTRATGTEVDGAREVLERRRTGDTDAAHCWDAAVEALSFSIAQLCASVGPEAVIVGGGLAQAGDDLLVPLRAAVDARLSFHRTPRIITAELGQDAGLRGAYLRAEAARSAATKETP